MSSESPSWCTYDQLFAFAGCKQDRGPCVKAMPTLLQLRLLTAAPFSPPHFPANVQFPFVSKQATARMEQA